MTALERLEAENYIMRESLKYLADRSDRGPERLREWEPVVAVAALQVLADDERLALYAGMGRRQAVSSASL